MNDVLESAIKSCSESNVAFSKFITANDVGLTGGHQAGFHIHKHSWPLFFDRPGEKGQNKDIYIKIKWQNDFETESRFIYYGVGTRNEYRLTRFGRGFPFLKNENVGDLLVISKKDDKLMATGGRVLVCVGMGKNVKEARDEAYEIVKCVHFDGMKYRKDIAYQAI
jgi:hypothetical protein